MALREHRLFGPPGTGKTTSLTHNLTTAAEKVGVAGVFVASFTRAASAELTSRVSGFPKDRIGTLHSHGFRAIGAPPLVDADSLADWNARHPGLELPSDLYDRDRERLFEAAFGDDDGPEQRHDRYQTLRNMLLPRHLWPASVAHFGERWDAWKAERGIVDFTDMIELALRTTDAAPGEPAIGFFDEVQDFTPLELALVRHWGAAMEQIVLAGDDDQMIYGFKGASVDAFLDGSVEPASVRVLKQSYRVPRAVHRVATRWISQVRRREEKPYLPRDEEGEARVLWDVSLDDGDELVRLIEERLARDPRWTVMVIVDAARMLAPVIRALREAGLPYHNPFAETRGDWNPLRTTGKGVSSSRRLVALSRYDEATWGTDARRWSADEVAHWAEPLKADGVFVRGGKARAKALDERYALEDLAACFEGGLAEGGALDRAGLFDLAWYEDHLTAEFKRRLTFPLAVARRRGARALLAAPRLVVGTIHSVKGAEASTVILAPDLSLFRQQDLEDGGDLADNVVRLFYVGMTRARHELLVTAPCGRRSIHPHDLLGVA